MASFETAAYEPGHRDDYLRLLAEAWGNRTMSPDEFDWWFERNPAGSLMSVATIDDRVVGVASHSLFRMVLDGREETVGFSVHATTHVSARGRGIFAELERRNEREATERGAAAVLAFASGPTAPIFLGPLGWTEVARYRVWARPLLRGHGSPTQSGAVRVEGDAARTWPNHVVRDEHHLTWRYADSPRGYRIVPAGEGYAVVGRTWYRGIETAVLADLVGSRDVLGRAVAVARGRLMIALPAPGQRRLFLSMGFVPAPYTLHFMGKPLAGKLNPDPRAWRFTLGDTDFF
jgi:GNAT superfamily N-acetyltransferase